MTKDTRIVELKDDDLDSVNGGIITGPGPGGGPNITAAGPGGGPHIVSAGAGGGPNIRNRDRTGILLAGDSNDT